MTTRHDNKGLRKLCAHPRRTWAKCPCPWHFHFKWKNTHHRFSLDKHLDRHPDSRSDAEDEAAKIRIAIKSGQFGQPTTVVDMTLRGLADVYIERYVAVQRAATAHSFAGELSVICRTRLPRVGGGEIDLGALRVADIVTDTIERFREARHAKGVQNGVNRSLSRLRALFNWAVRTGYIERTPFRKNDVSLVKLSREAPRDRRLNADLDEETRILRECDPHLYAVIVCAIESGLRRGEILGLHWRDVQGITVTGTAITWAARPEIVLQAERTKTGRARRIPISTRLRAVLDMRRFDPSGEPHGPDAFCFGTEIGTKVTNFKRAWHTAVLKAHGIRPTYTPTQNLDRASRDAFATIDLHFHDLRREAGSRWLDHGVPLHVVRDWLGHTSIAQTSTYLGTTQRTAHDAMSAYEGRLQHLATAAQKGGHTGPRSAVEGDKKPSKTAIGGGRVVM